MLAKVYNPFESTTAGLDHGLRCGLPETTLIAFRPS